MIVSSTILLALSVYATDVTQIGYDETNLAMKPETADLLRTPLLMDAFNKLDLNHDGVLDKEERKPLKYKSYLATASFYSEGDHVSRDVFVNNVVVPDVGDFEGNDFQCHAEDAVVHVNPEELWTHLAGGDESRAWMSVTDFADALYDKAEVDQSISFDEFAAFAAQGTTNIDQDPHTNDRFHLTKLGDYTESHNNRCKTNQVARRQLFIQLAPIVAVFMAALRMIAIAILGAIAECGVQEFFHHYTPNGYLNQLYSEGCTWNALQTDFLFNMGAQIFNPLGQWMYGSVTTYLGWGTTAAAVGGTADAELLGVPLLAETGVQTVSNVVESGTQTAVNAVEEGVQTVTSWIGL